MYISEIAIGSPSRIFVLLQLGSLCGIQSRTKNQSSCSRSYRSPQGLYPPRPSLRISHNFLHHHCNSASNRNNGGLLLLSSIWILFDPVPPSAPPSNIKTVHMTREGILVRTHPFSRHNTAPDETETSIRMLKDYTRIFMRGAAR